MTTTPKTSPTLLTNRYGVTTPTVIQANGCAISTPFYINPTNDQTKQLLNAFRVVKQKQLLEANLETSPAPAPNGLTVETAKTLPLTPIEQEIGMNEHSLRHVLFGRQGIPERLVLKLQQLTGVTLVTREQIEDGFKQWVDHLYQDETPKKTQRKQTVSTTS